MLREELTGLLREFIAIRSVTGEEKALSDCILEKLRRAGLPAEQDADGNVVCFVGEGPPTLVVNGHLDTVPPAEGWQTDPFEPVVRGERIYGLGASDMKGGLAVMVALARAVRPRSRVAFTFTVNEEGGATSPRNGARTFTERYDFEAALTCEPTYDEEAGRLRLGIGCQGRSIARVTVRGRACHSAVFEQGVNAVYRAVPVIQRVEARARTLEPVEVAPGVSVRPALSVTCVRAGGAENVIPGACRLTIDRRLAPGEDFDTFARELEEFTRGVDCEVEQLRGSLPVVADLEAPLARLAGRLLEERYGTVNYFFNPGRVDLSYFVAKARDVLILGPGVRGTPHRADEYASVPALVDAYEVLKALLERWPG